MAVTPLWRGAPRRVEQPAQGSGDKRVPVSDRMRRMLMRRNRVEEQVGLSRVEQVKQLRLREDGPHERHAIVRSQFRVVRARASGVNPMLQFAPSGHGEVHDCRGRGQLQDTPGWGEG